MKNQTDLQKKGNPKALIPFIAFLALYLGTGIVLHLSGMDMAFYQFPMATAVSIGVVIAFFLYKGTMDEKMDTFLTGLGGKNIMIMCTVYLLAGAFSTVSGAMGGVDSVVNLGLNLVPSQYLVAGIFLISGFISLASGTSMGTMAAVTPIAIGLADKVEVSLPFLMAAVIGGAMFGDNLSIISDTTIAATTTQGVRMRDKFKINLFIAVPAAVITLILLLVFSGGHGVSSMQTYDYNLIKIIPYFAVLVLAIAGVNVFAVLTGGIVLSGIIGLAYGDLSLLAFSQEIYNGFTSMISVFLVSMITGGLAKMMTEAGGLQYIVNKISTRIKSKNSAELGISAITALTDLSIANNTVSIIIDGPIVKDISREYKVDPRRSAALMDIFACVMQGALPYGAQILMVMGLTKGVVGPLQVIPLLWYQMLLALFAIASIYIPFSNGLIKNNPWNWEKGEPVEG